MGEALLTILSMENYHPSTLLSMDSGTFNHDDHMEREMNQTVSPSRPPDINLPLSSEPSPPPSLTWNDPLDILDASLGPQMYEAETIVDIPKVAKKCMKRLDSVWGAWFFFRFYFKPVLSESSKSKMIKDAHCLSRFDKSDLQLDAFLVQHDMENMYMWVFKGRPENALGKMQLRSYMNGHSRQGERPFPFTVEKGFVRSHRMQRKHYRGLSNPQCIHGIELVQSPNLINLDEEEKRRWMELTGRDINFAIPLEASDFSSWRNLPSTEFEHHRPSLPLRGNGNHNHNPKKLPNGPILNLSTHSSDNINGDSINITAVCNKRKKDCLSNGNGVECLPNSTHCDKLDVNLHPFEPVWLKEFNGVMKNVHGPVTAAKTIYEDEDAYLVVVSLPFADVLRAKVTWRNTNTHGIVKISCASTACMPFLERHGRTFKLTDPTPEHSPPGEFIREIPLPNRIPEDARLEAFHDEKGTMLEIIVPKHRTGPEEHEVCVCLRPSSWNE